MLKANVAAVSTQNLAAVGFGGTPQNLGVGLVRLGWCTQRRTLKTKVAAVGVAGKRGWGGACGDGLGSSRGHLRPKKKVPMPQEGANADSGALPATSNDASATRKMPMLTGGHLQPSE
eukprot:1159997-Pelagomonas_calceolata.AAC.5